MTNPAPAATPVSEWERPNVDASEPAVDEAQAQPTDTIESTDSGEQRLFVWGGVLAALGRYFTPPAPWALQPASLSELSSYAKVAKWAPRRGVRRRLGITYWYLIGLPTTVALRYGEWLVERPGRLVTALTVAAILWRTSFGRTTVHFIGWALHWPLYPLTWLF
jgi:hypothetical protein